ncbi:MAG: DNA gyrase/topoisomerase IV subunit A [Flavobacteriales bacterium]|nr:DNA gyrase/topoisomerase IV subunit A [Flavobacteriales bacterium]
MDEQNNNTPSPTPHQDRLLRVDSMFENWFLDYASYVILERAVPDINDGFKPVQRRVIHSMRELEDGRYNKVANIVGNTMKYHPHGDASIKDALTQLGQKELLIDMQGNWGNILTGDGAAAGRYIEARLSKFALDTVFNPKITKWQTSYDGRNQEPIFFPMKFPLLLAQGVDGIAVGLSTKILPHNFIELIDSSIAILEERPYELYPDFPQGGVADVSSYEDGKRGGRVRVRAKIRVSDKSTLIIDEIPYSTTSESLKESILKANDKGKIKIKSIDDNTAQKVEIVIHLSQGISPDKTIDALYAFTDCEVSLSPICCVIKDSKPAFLGVSEILEYSTERTKEMLRQELQVKLDELQSQWHITSLEKIFIEQRIYKLFDGLSYEQAIDITAEKLKPFEEKLISPITNDDLEHLMEIKMRRITRHDAEKADRLIADLEEQMAVIKDQLSHMVRTTIEYFQNLKKKYGKGRERKTELRAFDNIEAAKVAIQNTKLFVDKANGFIGYNLKKGEGEYVCDCSDLDDIIVFRKNGSFIVQKITQKSFVGKDIVYAGVWKKKDKRTIYNLIYKDGASGWSFMKRFAVTAVTRDRAYEHGKKGSELLYLTVNPNGEAEKVNVFLRSQAKLRKLKIEIDFATLAVKGQLVKGNLVTKYPVRKVELAEKGVSTLSAREIWLDETIMRLNDEGRGRSLGNFHGDDKIMEITTSGEIRILSYDFERHFEMDSPVIVKWKKNMTVSAVYYDGEKKKYFVKRFSPEKTQRPEMFISQSKGSFMAFVSVDHLPMIHVSYAKEKGVAPREDEDINIAEFITVKGIKAQGNQLSADKIKDIKALASLPYDEPEEEEEEIEEDVDEDFSENEQDEPQTSQEDEDEFSKEPDTQQEESSEEQIEGSVNDDGQVSLF